MDKDESNMLFLGLFFRVQKKTGMTSNQIAAERISEWDETVSEYVSCDISGII